MLPKKIIILLFSLLLPLLAWSSHAQEVNEEQPEPVLHSLGTLLGTHEGYTLFTPGPSDKVYLIDAEGRLVHEWTVSGHGRDAFLRENGNLVVTVERQTPLPESQTFAEFTEFTAIDGRFEEYTWDGELVWAFEFDRPNHHVHHGIEVKPDGNILFIAWEYKTNEEAIANGRDPALLGDGLWTDVILEYDPQQDDIVWEWHAWDHLIQDFDPNQANYGVVADHPHRIDINFFQEYEWIEDWLHVNAVDYNPALDQLVIDAREFNEVWVVDQSTSTEEARGAAGDLLYRWGNPRAYDRGDEEDRWLGFQHDVQWIADGLPGAGNFILYSNRHALTINEFDPLFYSRIVEWTPPLQADGSYPLADGEAYEPAEPVWVYDGFPDDMFFSRFVSGVQRLPNGNTLVTRGQNALLFEVSPANEVVWAYRVPVRVNLPVPQGVQPNATVFRARRYEVDFPGFEGRDLTPGLTLEDFAGSAPTATARLAMEDALVASLTAAIPQRFYTFETAEDQLIQIDLTSLTDGFVPTLTLLDRDGEPIVVADSERVTVEAGLDNYRIPETGEYTLIISAGAESSGSGEFALHISDVGKLFEDIDSSIPRLLYGTVLTDQVTPDDASSTFVFYGEVGDVITLSMTVGEGDLTPLIELRSAAEETLIAAGEAGEGQAQIEGYRLPASGVYYIYAGQLTDNGAQADTTGSFELQLIEEEAP